MRKWGPGRGVLEMLLGAFCLREGPLVLGMVVIMMEILQIM
jgi:hypothetical protein